MAGVTAAGKQGGHEGLHAAAAGCGCVCVHGAWVPWGVWAQGWVSFPCYMRRRTKLLCPLHVAMATLCCLAW